MSFSLRDYQDDIATKIRLAIRRTVKRMLVVAATGAGKTVIFSYIALMASQLGNNVLILAHRDQLIKQASDKLRNYGVSHGIIMSGYTPDPVSRVQVASVQTLIRRLGKIRFVPKIIIVDEAHLSAAKSYREILDHFPDAIVIGFTGSPCRLDNKPLGRTVGGLYDELIEAISIRRLIDRGFLVRPVHFGSDAVLDLSGVKKQAGDYNQAQLAKAVDKPKLYGDAIRMYQKICPGRPAVAWCVNINHAQHVSDAFNAAGIPSVMLCGDDKSDRRDAVLKQLASGAVKVVTFVGILIEGVDCPEIEAIIILRPTMSLASYLQVIGRGLRPLYLPGAPLATDADRLAAISGSHKTCCYVIDHANLWVRHGFADEEREWSLLEGEVKKKAKRKADDEPRSDLIMCAGTDSRGVKGCFRVFEPAPACPFCGKLVEARVRKIEQVDGDLKEITPEMMAAMRNSRQKEVRSAKTIEDLLKIAAERGYSSAWAHNMFRAKERTREKYRPQRPPEPTLDELKAMSLDELEVVARQQGWPTDWPSNFYYSQQNLGGF